MSGKLRTCPYNPAHQIRPERIQYHLLKCRRNYPDMSMVICPYNATHHVNIRDEQAHMRQCPDRRIVEIQRFKLNEPLPGQHGDLSGPAVFGSSSIPPEPEAADAAPHRRYADPSGMESALDTTLNRTSVSSIAVADLIRSGRSEFVLQRPETFGRKDQMRALLESRPSPFDFETSRPVPPNDEDDEEEEEEEVVISGNFLLSPGDPRMINEPTDEDFRRPARSPRADHVPLRRPKNVLF